jgi:hypothetical protein
VDFIEDVQLFLIVFYLALGEQIHRVVVCGKLVSFEELDSSLI